jgi:acylphosphatase
MGAKTAVRATVHGAVQGIGFRAATVARAHAAGALGWVRNGEDGTVQVHAEGTEEAVERLLAFLRSGPRGAQVAEVAVERVRPEGHEQFAIRGVSAGAFVVRRTARGYELCLQVEGVMRRWALPKEPSLDPAVKRFAIEQAGAGEARDDDEAQAWDRGSYEQGGRVPWPEALARGHAVFVLHGERLRGGFALQRTRGGPGAGAGVQWLLVKRRDDEARPGGR